MVEKIDLKELESNFIKKCISIIKNHVENKNFNIRLLSKKMGMSHSNLYKKIKVILGVPIVALILKLDLKELRNF